MGKEWLYWVGGGVSSSSSRSATKRGRSGAEMKEASAGCMCAVYHLLHLHFPSTHRNHSNTHPNINIYPFLQDEPTTTTTGVEAPRNSLELEKTAAVGVASITLAMKQEEDLNFPVGIKIKRNDGKSKARLYDISSECNSPATKTPSVVARLMGLDLLPECTSPSTRTKYNRDDIAAGARSLPETPRVSRSDVERHRLSLQISTDEEFGLSDDKTAARRGRFKLVKDSANRKTFGLDITNTNQSRRDENLLLLPLKPAERNNCKIPSKYEDQKISDHNKIKLPTRSSRIPSSCENHQHNRTPTLQEQQHKDSCRKVPKCSSSKKLPPRAVRNRKEDGFVVGSRSRESSKLNLRDNKSKRTLLSCNTILQVKKTPSSPPPPANLPQQLSQVSDALSSKSSTQLSSKPSQSYKQLHNKILIPPEVVTTRCSATASPEHRNYIQTILKHADIINQANPLAKWNTPSNPLHPRIFHLLEHNAAARNTVLSHHCNRRLIFNLVDELLADILTPRFNLSRWVSPVGDDDCFPLVDELCKRIESFPAANCVVLEDIDSLIDTDLCKSQLNGYFGEEENMVIEIEGEIVEWLVRETVAVIGGDAAEEQAETGIYHVGL